MLLRLHSPGHAQHAGPIRRSVAWDLHGVQQLPVSCRKQQQACTVHLSSNTIIMNRQVTEFLTRDFHPKPTPFLKKILYSALLTNICF